MSASGFCRCSCCCLAASGALLLLLRPLTVLVALLCMCGSALLLLLLVIGCFLSVLPRSRTTYMSPPDSRRPITRRQPPLDAACSICSRVITMSAQLTEGITPESLMK